VQDPGAWTLAARLGEARESEGDIVRKLKLQMQVSVDGYVAGPEGQLDWMTWDWDDELKSGAACACSRRRRR
jgi:hypothetical protein